MARIISPPADQIDNLRQPLTPGERMVFEFFDTHLAREWEIYLQPHLNGLRPDFVLMNPHAGIAVFEVKDWNLDAMEYVVKEREGRCPILLGKKDGKSFSPKPYPWLKKPRAEAREEIRKHGHAKKMAA